MEAPPEHRGTISPPLIMASMMRWRRISNDDADKDGVRIHEDGDDEEDGELRVLIKPKLFVKIWTHFVFVKWQNNPKYENFRMQSRLKPLFRPLCASSAASPASSLSAPRSDDQYDQHQLASGSIWF